LAKSPEKAVSACKGLAQKDCETNDACTFVAATKRKDGRAVSAYCRTKPVKTTKATVSKSAPVAKSETPAKSATTAPAKKN
jgi:hypothetical protein